MGAKPLFEAVDERCTAFRLVRGGLGEDVFDRDNGAARDLGRRLSAARDAAVRVSALDTLQKSYPEEFPSEEIAPLRRRLLSRQRAALRRVRSDGSLAAVARELGELRLRVRAWPVFEAGFACLGPGMRRVYRQGRDAEAEAYASGTDEAFHEWRKRAKDFRYHVELLEPLWPEVMKDVEKALHDLTDRLGDDHDLADLRGALSTSPRLTRGVRVVPRVLELADRRRSKLQADARPIGSRIYGEKPRAFSSRIAGYWNAWRS